MDWIDVMYKSEKAHWYWVDECNYKNKESVFFDEFLWFLGFPRWKIRNMRYGFMVHKQSIPVGGCVIHGDKGNILMVSHYSEGNRQLPKGKVERGEEPIDCAIREMKEELGITLEKSYLVNPVSLGFGNHHERIEHFFNVYGVSEDICFSAETRNEIKGYHWVNPRNLSRRWARYVRNQ